MSSTEKGKSLNELIGKLKDAADVLERLEDIQADYPCLYQELNDAREAIEETLEIDFDEVRGLTYELDREHRRVSELGFYVRALQEFSRDAHVTLPSFIISGFEKLSRPYCQCPEPVDDGLEDPDKSPLFQ